MCNSGDTGLIPGSGSSPGEGNGNPLQYSCLESPMDRRAWWATVHGVTKSRTRLSDQHFHWDMRNLQVTGIEIRTWGFSHSLLLLLSRFSRVRVCATPWTAAHQAPPSRGFSRQEHRSGLPWPSPAHESEKWKWSRSVVPNSQRPRGLQPTRLLHPWDSPGKSPGVGRHRLLHSHSVIY